MANSRVLFLFVFSLIVLSTTPAFSNPSCKSTKFSTDKTFDNCIDLPTLNAVLHYTYTNSILSMGFTAPPPDSTGWVAWAINPKSTGMAGAQTLIAYKPKSGPINVNTLNIVSYSNLIDGPISYNVTNLSAEESNGIVSFFATWVIPSGKTTVNTIWQVGPIANGKPIVHAFEPENLGSTLKLTLTVSEPAEAPTMSNSESPTMSIIGAPGSSPIGTPVGAPEGQSLAPESSPIGAPVGAPEGLSLAPSMSVSDSPTMSTIGAPGSSPIGSPVGAQAPLTSGAHKSLVSVLVMALSAIMVCLF